jgi:glycosyltransferase involved in cell wall biosynthesis
MDHGQSATRRGFGLRRHPASLLSRLSLRLQRPSDRGARVLHLVDTLGVGGTECQLVQTAIRQRSASHEVTVGCLHAEGPMLQALQRARIPVVEFRKGKTLRSANGIYQLLRLVIFLRRGKFQVVHAHDLWANVLGAFAAWLARTPVIISSRRYLEDLHEWDSPWRSAMNRIVYRLSTLVVVNARAIRDVLVKKEGVPAEKVSVVYNGVDVNRFAYAPRDRDKVLPDVGREAKVVAVLGNMYSPMKGHAFLVEAARHVCRKQRDVVFLLIGDGKERPKLEQQVREAGLERQILFLGRREDIPELLACCDLSVLPSEAEGLPNSVLEAMAAGLPVVATCVGGVPEVIRDGMDGLLVPPRDPGALAEAILRALYDPDLAKKLAAVGQQRVRTRFSFDRLVTTLEQLYRDGETLPLHLESLTG